MASLDLFKKENTLKKIKKISLIHKECLEKISKKSNVSKVRTIGSIAAFDYNKIDTKYGSKESEILKKKIFRKWFVVKASWKYDLHYATILH